MSITAADARRVDAAPRRAAGSLAGFGRLVGLMIRRDRVRVTLWFAGIVGFVGLSAASVVGLYSSPGELRSYARLAGAEAALKAVVGPGYGLDDPTRGAVVMNEVELYAFIAIALMAVLMVTRHTRSEEESGRAELVRSCPVGRHASLAAACAWTSVTVLAVAGGLLAAMLLVGLAFVGSLAFAAACAAIGVAFVGVAALCAQVADTGRAANSIAGVTLAAMFMLRAVGDVGVEWLRWTSPLGWAQGIRPFAGERWWVLIPLAVVALVSIAGAVVSSAHRDFGSGVLAQRPGPREAPRWMASPFALALRLQRGSIVGWTIGVGLTAFFFALIADETEELAENDAIADLLAQAGGSSITESFLATFMMLTALLASGFTVSSVLRLRSEEMERRAELVLAAPVSRRRWMWGQLGVSATGTVVIMVVAGLLAGVTYALQVGDAAEIVTLLVATTVLIPALFVLGALAAALHGLSPGWAPIAWAGVAFAVVVGLLASTLDLPQWLRNLSPVDHVPAVPAAPFELVPVVLLLVVITALVTVATLAFDRRDLA